VNYYVKIERIRELLPCGLQWRRLVKIFKKPKSRFYWFDFTVRGQRYRGSTGETKAVRATKVGSMKLAQAVEHGDLFPSRSRGLGEFSDRFLSWLDEARLEKKNQEVLPTWLPAVEDDPDFRHALGRNYS